MKTSEAINEYIEKRCEYYNEAKADIMIHVNKNDSACFFFEGARMALVDLLSWLESDDEDNRAS